MAAKNQRISAPQNPNLISALPMHHLTIKIIYIYIMNSEKRKQKTINVTDGCGSKHEDLVLRPPMVHLLPNYPRVSSHLCPEPARGAEAPTRPRLPGGVIWRRNNGGRARSRSGGAVLRCSHSSSISATEDLIVGVRDSNGELAAEHGWKVRKLIEEEDDLRTVARIQAEAFHEPAPLFNDFFYQFFQAEVLAALIYRLKNYPQDRYACLIAEPETETEAEAWNDDYNFVGVVDMTVAGDLKVKRHLPAGEKEYIFVSGIAVPESFRRRKVATALLKGCDVLAKAWGLKFLALSAYEDDYGARNLYSKAGYEVISADPLWKSSWIGRKRCVTMIKKL